MIPWKQPSKNDVIMSLDATQREVSVYLGFRPLSSHVFNQAPDWQSVIVGFSFPLFSYQ
jgi:hypothetical protein